MGIFKFKVNGMTCDHCVKTIKKAVGEVSGVQEVTVNLDKKEVVVKVEGIEVPRQTLSDKIVEAGFEVVAG